MAVGSPGGYLKSESEKNRKLGTHCRVIWGGMWQILARVLLEGAVVLGLSVLRSARCKYGLYNAKKKRREG